MGASWNASAVSVVGTRHLEQGRECGDASHVHWDPELEFLVLCAADGAGEAKHAASGSAGAVEAVSGLAPELMKRYRADLENPDRLREILLELARDARAQLESVARRGEVPSPGAPVDDRSVPGSLHAYATTLLVVIVTPGYLASLQIGDGFILVVTKPPDMRVVFRPSKGEFANQTCFLTSFASFDELLADRQVQVNVRPSAGVCAVALITDGLEHVAMNMRGGGTPHPPFFLDLMAKLLKLMPAEYAKGLKGSLLGNERINAKTDDDKTLVLAVDTRNPPDLTASHYPQTPADPPGYPGGGGPGFVRKLPPEPKVIELSVDEADAEREEPSRWPLTEFGAEPTPLRLQGTTPPAATGAPGSHGRRFFLGGFLAALALVAVPFGVFLFVPQARTWFAETVTIAPPRPQSETIQSAEPAVEGAGEQDTLPGDLSAGQPAAAPSPAADALPEVTEVVVELCLAVTASQIEAGRARPGSELGLRIAEFDPDFGPQDGAYCLPRTGGAFGGEAIRIRLITEVAEGETDIRFVPESRYTISTEFRPDRRIYTSAVTTQDDSSLRYAFDVTLGPEFRYCGKSGSPVVAESDNPDDREVQILCR